MTNFINLLFMTYSSEFLFSSLNLKKNIFKEIHPVIWWQNGGFNFRSSLFIKMLATFSSKNLTPFYKDIVVQAQGSYLAAISLHLQLLWSSGWCYDFQHIHSLSHSGMLKKSLIRSKLENFSELKKMYLMLSIYQ